MTEAWDEAELREWPERLERAIGGAGDGLFREIRVLAETLSTQDAIRSIATGPGWVVTAGRQTRGRGRLGRAWADTAHLGIAVTCSLPDAAAERLVLLSAVATHRAIVGSASADQHDARRRTFGIKWPNDIVTKRGRKLAGMLIERVEINGTPCALVGSGINVGQLAFPPDLADLATSLALEGVAVRRIDLLARLLHELCGCWHEPIESLLAHAAEHDALRGAEVGCSTAEGAFEGRVVRADPMRGLIVQPAGEHGERLLPAATTAILWWRPPEGPVIEKRRADERRV